MDLWGALLVAVGVYALFVVLLVVLGRGAEARALVRLVPDCLVLFGRLLREPRVSRWRKLALVVGMAYLAFPIDLVPDFIPVAGQLDDVVVVVLVFRILARGVDSAVLDEHWPGPAESLAVVRRLAGRHSPVARPTA